MNRNNSIPQKSESYRIGESIFYTQFNDISFFIEDDDQENFYFAILNKLFSQVNISKIFPLGGKNAVQNSALRNVGDRKKVFIVDRDFEDILQEKMILPNLFHLDRYSIENHLIDEPAIIEYIISEKPRLNRQNVENRLNYRKLIKKVLKSLKHLTYCYLTIRRECNSLPSISRGCERYVRVIDGVPTIIDDQFETLYAEVEAKLKESDRRKTFKGRLRVTKHQVKLKNDLDLITVVPGKFILLTILKVVEKLFALNSRTVESFTYKLAVASDLNSLENLRNNINMYISK